MVFGRRETPRERAAWDARYFVEHRPDLGWRPCRVLDISTIGAALELRDARHSETAATRIVLELETVDGGGSIQLVAVVRHSEDTDDGAIRAGIQFVDLSPLELEVLEMLLARVWT